MTKIKTNQNKIQFSHNEEEINNIFQKIKNFGEIFDNYNSEIINKESFDKINEWIGGKNNFILKYSAKKDTCNMKFFMKSVMVLMGYNYM